jgi:hypothetical protein
MSDTQQKLAGESDKYVIEPGHSEDVDVLEQDHEDDESDEDSASGEEENSGEEIGSEGDHSGDEDSILAERKVLAAKTTLRTTSIPRKRTTKSMPMFPTADTTAATRGLLPTMTFRTAGVIPEATTM